MSKDRIHASCVALDERGVLIAGPSGAGKSDLALRMIDRGAQLVADDQTDLRFENNQLFASPPPTIAGLIELRHVGLLRLPYCASTHVTLYIELVTSGTVLERYPETDRILLLDHPVRRLRLNPWESSTPAKIRAVLLYPAAE